MDLNDSVDPRLQTFDRCLLYYLPAPRPMQGTRNGKRLHSYGLSLNHHHVMGKLTISMAILNSYVELPEGQ